MSRIHNNQQNIFFPQVNIHDFFLSLPLPCPFLASIFSFNLTPITLMPFSIHDHPPSSADVHTDAHCHNQLIYCIIGNPTLVLSLLFLSLPQAVLHALMSPRILLSFTEFLSHFLSVTILFSHTQLPVFT